MLIELRVRDFAVIDDLTLELEPGLNVLTGETGAGKSILVDALSLLLGERASTDVVRAGTERARVEAVFDVSKVKGFKERVASSGVEPEDGLVILRRDVAAQGRNRAWVNGSPTSASVVGEIGRFLADLHGQHEHQTLLRRGEQREILDAFAGVVELAGSVRRLHQQLEALERERDARKARQRELVTQADFLQFQYTEITEAELRLGEEEELAAAARRLAHSQELASESARLHAALHESDGSVVDRIAEAGDVLRRLAQLDPGLTAAREGLDDAYHRLAEAARELGSYASAVEHDPEGLRDVNMRLDLIARLKRKYGPTVEDVMAAADRLGKQLEELDDAEEGLEDLERRIAAVERDLEDLARDLSVARSEAALRLAAQVQALMPSLGLAGAKLEILLEPTERIGAEGAEQVEFRASLNPGFATRPLAKIASGGELARVMLALKTILADVDRIPTLVFDEVDAGIGGLVATAVGEKLREVAERHQVFVVTHLAQIASRADLHLEVSKDAEGGLATTRIRALRGEDRVREIARMLGGDPESHLSRDHARELLAVD